MRAVRNAILYIVVSGCQWRMLPKEYPNWQSVSSYYAAWRDAGTWQRIHDTLHATPAADAPLAAQPLTEQVKVFERIERGKLDRHRADPTFIREVEQAVDQIIAVLYTPLDGRPFIVPRDAWTHSPLMKLLASVTYWLYQDDLISMADAARLVYGASDDALLSRIRRMIERGQLRHYWLPGREAKQRSYLVRRSEVEQVQQHQHEE
jgi:hypothetical protein